MTAFTPILRQCAGCGCDLSIYTLEDNYPACVLVDGQTICGDCFIAVNGLEPIVSFEYKPHVLVWPVLPEIDEEAENELAEEAEVISQLSLWEQTA